MTPSASSSSQDSDPSSVRPTPSNLRPSCQFLIVGAGLMGSSVAWHLARLGAQDIQVVDLDLAGTFSSSELNAGGVRATWNHALNAAIASESIDYFASHADEIGFLQRGYTWMYSKQTWVTRLEQIQNIPHLQTLNMEPLDPKELQERFPFINKTSDLGGATFSPRDGLLNPNLLKLHYQKQAKSLGVHFCNRVWIHDVTRLDASSCELKAWQFDSTLNEETIRQILENPQKDPLSAQGCPHESKTIRAKILINCAGPWAPLISALSGSPSHSYPQRRQIALIEAKDVNLKPYGMFVDPSGVYFHSEGEHILTGYALPSEPKGYRLHYDGASFLEEHLWPILYERSSAFENLKHVTGWGGLYEVSPDHCGVVGRSGFTYEAHSFSGRGVMQSYAVGRGLAELILLGSFQTMDLTPLNGSRFEQGSLIQENLII